MRILPLKSMAKATSLSVAQDWDWPNSCPLSVLAGLWSKPQDPEPDPSTSVYSVIFSKEQKERTSISADKGVPLLHSHLGPNSMVWLLLLCKDETVAPKHYCLIVITFSPMSSFPFATGMYAAK